MIMRLLNLNVRHASIAAILALSACSTTPIPTHEARAVKPLQSFLQRVPPGSAEVVIKRDAGFRGSACTMRVYVDGIAAAMLEPGEKVTLMLPVGDHVFGAEPSGAFCGSVIVETRATVTRDKPSVFRIWTSIDTFAIQPTAF